MKKPFSIVLILGSMLAAAFIGGCGNNDSVPKHTSEEQKLIDQIAKETPEQQIERIQRGPMPDAAKKAMIDKIKSEHGIK